MADQNPKRKNLCRQRFLCGITVSGLLIMNLAFDLWNQYGVSKMDAEN